MHQLFVLYLVYTIVILALSSSLVADTSPMLVHLAGVELTPDGWEWLQKNLAPAQTVWLKLISRENNVLHCLVCQSRVRHHKQTQSGDMIVDRSYLFPLMAGAYA